MSRKDPLFQRLARQLQSVAESCFIEKLEEGENAHHMMEPLPGAIEVERRRCLSGGIPEDLVDNILNLAWQNACNQYTNWPEKAIAALKSLRGRLHKTHMKNPSASLKAEECCICGSDINDTIRRGERLLFKRHTPA